jgi:predicted nucleic acid-binding protein
MLFIAALDRGDAHHQSAARAVKRLAGAETELLISAVNYAESLCQAIARNAARHRGRESASPMASRSLRRLSTKPLPRHSTSEFAALFLWSACGSASNFTDRF